MIETKDLKQIVEFENTSPHDIFEVLMDTKKHARLTGDKAEISREVGGKSSAYDGWIEAINTEIVLDRKIVQKWRGVDWPEGHYSFATFEIEKIGNRSKLIFTQTGIPEDKFDEVAEGWKEHYWEKMKKMLAD